MSPLQKLANRKRTTVNRLNEARNAIDAAVAEWGLHAAQGDDIKQRIQDLETVVEKQWQEERSELVTR